MAVDCQEDLAFAGESIHQLLCHWQEALEWYDSFQQKGTAHDVSYLTTYLGDFKAWKEVRITPGLDVSSHACLPPPSMSLHDHQHPLSVGA